MTHIVSKKKQFFHSTIIIGCYILDIAVTLIAVKREVT